MMSECGDGIRFDYFIHCVGLYWIGFSAPGVWLLGSFGYKTFNACISTLEIVPFWVVIGCAG